jgi:hypothetical protein
LLTYPVVEEGNQAIGIHGFTSIELEILEISTDFLEVIRGPLFKGLDTIRVRLLELGLDGLHVALDVGNVALLVEPGALESEGMDDVVHLSGSLLKSILLILRGGVGTYS